MGIDFSNVDLSGIPIVDEPKKSSKNTYTGYRNNKNSNAYSKANKEIPKDAKDNLSVYDVTLICEGPLYIGSGSELTKKEYMIDTDNSNKPIAVRIPSFEKMYGSLMDKGLLEEYEKFMCDNDCAETLGEWLSAIDSISSQEIESWDNRVLRGIGDAISEGKESFAINTFMRDGMEAPYVPGSSLKGMLRTILLGYYVSNNKDNLKWERQQIKDVCKEFKNKSKNAVDALKKINSVADSVEKKCFVETWKEDGKPVEINYMSGLKISDSKPLSNLDMVLCQKLDQDRTGKENHINILRESVMPGTNISFTMTLDSNVINSKFLSKFQCNDKTSFVKLLSNAIKANSSAYYENFLKNFGNSGAAVPGESTVWLGGGVGFVSKTVVYSMFSHNEAIEIINAIFDMDEQSKKNSKKAITHKEDSLVAPKMVKLTKYNNNLKEFGRCKIQIKPREL